MNTNETTVIENFIDFCDDMMITNEGHLMDKIKEDPIFAINAGITALAGVGVLSVTLSYKLKNKIEKHKEKKAAKILDKQRETVYIIDNKKYDGVYKLQDKISLSVNKMTPLYNYVYLVESGFPNPKDKQVSLHTSHKSILTQKVFLYTLDGSKSTKVDQYNSVVATSDLPIKEIEIGTYGELLKKYGISTNISTINVDARKSLVLKLGKEYVAEMKKLGITKGFEQETLDDFDMAEFIYGERNTVCITYCDLWDYNPEARTNREKNDKIYEAMSKVTKLMNDKYPQYTFTDDGGDWDDLLVEVTIKK